MEKTAFAPIATLRERLMLIAKALMPLAPMALAVLWLKRVAKDSQFVLCHPYGADAIEHDSHHGHDSRQVCEQHFAASSISAARAQNIQPHPLSPWLAGSGAGMVDSGFNKLCICSFSLWRLAGA